jgi:hypothetical protein
MPPSPPLEEYIRTLALQQNRNKLGFPPNFLNKFLDKLCRSDFIIMSY